MSTEGLIAHAHIYINNSIAPSTRLTYQAAYTRYINFCHAHGLQVLPLTSQTTILFMTHLATSGLAYRTLKIYLAGIIRMHIEAGYSNTIRDDCLLQCTLKGIKRIHGEVANTRLPITIEVMRILKDSLMKSNNYTKPDKHMLWAAYTLAFFAFLRVSEFTAPSSSRFDPVNTLLGSDVNINKDLEVNIKMSKTDPFRQGCSITVAPSGSEICAVEAFKTYCAFRPLINHLPAFQFVDGRFLTRQALGDSIRDLLTSAKVPNVHQYTTHSFRSGAATTAAEVNLPDWLIKALGRWRSDSYQVYIKTPKTVLRSVPSRLTGH